MALSILAAVIGGGLDLIAEDAAQKQREEQAARNKVMADQAAADALHRGSIEAGRLRLRASAITSRQRVAYAKSGVDGGVGTAAQVILDTRTMGELDAKTVENNALREAYGFKKHGKEFLAQAAYDRQASNMRAAGTLLTTGGRAASAYGRSRSRAPAEAPLEDYDY